MKRGIINRINNLESTYQSIVEERNFRQAQEEVKAIVDALTEKYNSPEEVAKRKAEYDELRRIGKLREQAFKRGEDMNQYPLPWETKPNPNDEEWFREIMEEIEKATNPYND